MPLKYPPPKRCKLDQAALWFVNGITPLPSDLYYSASISLDWTNIELLELFIAMRQHDCDLRGTMEIGFRPMEFIGDRSEKSLDAGCRFVAEFKEFNMKIEKELLHLPSIDFSKNIVFYEAALPTNPPAVDEIIDKWRRKFEDSIHHQWAPYLYFHIVSIDFQKLKDALAEETETSQARKTHRAGAKNCEEWLLGLMSDNKPKEASKTEYRERALKEFHVSARQFNFAWSNAIAEAGNTEWSKPGRVQS
jgi:hypothetical protein